MAVDPETLSYTGVEPALLDRLAVAYRRGLDEKLAERRVETTEVLPVLVFVGHTPEPEPWTMLETSQGTHWYFGHGIIDELQLAETAYQFGLAEGDDHWF